MAMKEDNDSSVKWAKRFEECDSDYFRYQELLLEEVREAHRHRFEAPDMASEKIARLYIALGFLYAALGYAVRSSGGQLAGSINGIILWVGVTGLGMALIQSMFMLMPTTRHLPGIGWVEDWNGDREPSKLAAVKVRSEAIRNYIASIQSFDKQVAPRLRWQNRVVRGGIFVAIAALVVSSALTAFRSTSDGGNTDMATPAVGYSDPNERERPDVDILETGESTPDDQTVYGVNRE